MRRIGGHGISLAHNGQERSAIPRHRTGNGDSAVIEEALRRDLGLDALERLWERTDLSEDESMELAVEAQHRTRRRSR